MSSNANENVCCEPNCLNPVRYIRHTQFAGSHPLCEKHARQDKRFLQDDSYMEWEIVE